MDGLPVDIAALALPLDLIKIADAGAPGCCSSNRALPCAGATHRAANVGIAAVLDLIKIAGWRLLWCAQEGVHVPKMSGSQLEGSYRRAGRAAEKGIGTLDACLGKAVLCWPAARLAARPAPHPTPLSPPGLLRADWPAAFPSNSVVCESVCAIVVRKGNPKNICGWEDLGECRTWVAVHIIRRGWEGFAGVCGSWRGVHAGPGGRRQLWAARLRQVGHGLPARDGDVAVSAASLGRCSLHPPASPGAHLSSLGSYSPLRRPPAPLQRRDDVAVVTANSCLSQAYPVSVPSFQPACHPPAPLQRATTWR